MKTIIKLVIVVAIVNATYRAGDAFWRFYQLKDSAQQTLIFGDKAPPAKLQEQILSRAGELKIPLAAENVVVTREGARSAARVAYQSGIELFPRYVYVHDFAFNVDAVAIR